MDMYQKRKMRAEKKNNNNQESFPKVSNSCLNLFYLTTQEKPYKIKEI